jgi:hypothetical protein
VALGVSAQGSAAEALKVDIGSDPQAVQEGFEAWSPGPHNTTVTGVTMLFTAFGGVTVSLMNADGTDNGLAIRERVQNATGPLAALIQDAIKQGPGGGLMRLVFSQLKAGVYRITTYHHDASFVHGTMDLYLTDANGVDQLAADELQISTGAVDPVVTTASFLFRSDGVNDVYLRMAIGSDANNAEVWLNGFELQASTEDAVRITKHPVSAAAMLGSSATFMVEATSVSGASNFTYRWQKNGGDIAGATGASYTLASVKAEDAGKYRCVVSLPGDGSATSLEALLRIQAPATFPTVTSGTLLVHLKADAGVTSDASGVTTWKDQSPNKYDFVSQADGMAILHPQSEIGLTGNRIVRFNGNAILKSSALLQLFTETNSGLSIFTAFSTPNNSGQKFLVNWGIKDLDNNRGNVELGYDTGNGAGVGNFGLHYGCGQATLAPADTVANNEFVIMSTLVKSAGDPPANVAIYKNGVPLLLAINGPGGCPPVHAGWLKPGEYQTGEAALDIGARDDSGAGSFGSYHIGDIGEVIVYRGTLSETDRAAVEQYLGDRYGLATGLPPIAMEIGRSVRLSYPLAAFDHILEGADNPTGPWTAVPNTPVIVGGQYQVVIEGPGNKYYQLRKP